MGDVNFGRDSNNKKLKVLISSLRVKSDSMAIIPLLTYPLFSNGSSRIFGKLILSKTDQKSYNKNPGVYTILQNPGAGFVNYTVGAYTVFLERMAV